MRKNMCLSILMISLLTFNAVADNTQFGGPEQVNNRIKEDSADRNLPLKEKLAADGRVFCGKTF